MAQDLRSIYSDFNIRANRLFFQMFQEFRNEADKIEPDTRSNEVQLLRGKYIQELKARLTKMTAEHLEFCKDDSEQGRLRNGLADRVKYFAREFLRKPLE